MTVDFDKGNGLVPAIIQDSNTGKVLMLGYMNEESLRKTETEKRVCFYSRSRQRLWVKGEESGNFLYVDEIIGDCDNDTLLVKVRPAGPVCHTGADTCFNETNQKEYEFLAELEAVIRSRKSADSDTSYTASLFRRGVNKIAQKVGEEAAETIIDAVTGNRERFTEESADLIYHLLVLLASQDLSLSDVVRVLEGRHRR